MTERHRDTGGTLVERSLFSDNPTLHNIDRGINAYVKASNAEIVNIMVMKMYSVIFLKKKKKIYCNILRYFWW